MRMLLKVRAKVVEREGGWDKKGRIKRKNETGKEITSKVLPMFD